MDRYIALLKGVNVGAGKRIEMSGLRRAFMNLGFTAVETYIQSGNVIFSVSANDRAQLSALIEAKLASTFGFPVPVMLRTAAEMAAVVRNCPYQDDLAAKIETTSGIVSLHVAFLSSAPEPALIRKLDEYKKEIEDFHLAGREIYLFLPEGIHASKLVQVILKARPEATIRNWKTVFYLGNLDGEDRRQ